MRSLTPLDPTYQKILTEVPGTFLAFSTTATYIDNNIKTNLPFRKLAKETSVFCRSVFWHRLTTTNLSTVAT